MATKKPKRRKKRKSAKAKKKAFSKPGNLTMKAQIFEGETTIMKIKRTPLNKGINDINFFTEKKLNIKKRRRRTLKKKKKVK